MKMKGPPPFLLFSLTLWSVWLAAAALTQPTSCGYGHCLEANNSGSGEESLYQALTAAHKLKTSVEIRISGGGPFNLSNNDLLTFVNWKNLSLTGLGVAHTLLQCEEGIGLVFRNSSHVTLQGFTLEHCARFHNTTSIHMDSGNSNSDNSSRSQTGTKFVISRSGVYFDSCSNLTLRDVKVLNSSGMGVTVYNSNGTNLFTSSRFESNHLNADDRYFGGGGVVIETSHCVPGDVGCRDDQSDLETSDSSFIFNHCTFSSNRATSHYLPFDSVYPHGRSHMGVGRGGGMAVILKGHAHRNKVIVNHCSFRTNRAEWGAAVYLAFGDTSVGNSVLIHNRTTIVSNNFRDGRESDKNSITVGGALRIEIISYPPDPTLWPGYVSNVSGNAIVVRDTTFTRNFGTWGGAVSFVTTRNLPGQTSANSLRFESCVFMLNQAHVVGSALDIASWKPDIVDSKETFMKPVLQDCVFDSNKLPFSNITHYPVGIGAVYIINIPVQFLGSTLFTFNSGTALVVSETYILVMESSSMNFTQNSGRRGGALAFIGNSWLIAHENTHFLFDGNSVGTYGLGGAVYSVHFGEHDLIYEQNCFFQYHNFALPPSQWNATFVFEGNKVDHQPNSIYTTSSQPCTWHMAVRLHSDQIPGPFCETSTWIFKGAGRNCSNEIATGPKEVVVSQINIEVVPGWSTHLGTTMLNDFYKEVPSVLTASPAEDEDRDAIAVADSTTYIIDDEIMIYGQENTHGNLLLTTLDPRVIASEVTIHVLSCPPGFVPVRCTDEKLSGKICDCTCTHTPGIRCSNVTKKAYLQLLYCISYDSNRSSVMVSSCPYNHVDSFLLSNLTTQDLDEHICARFNRKGLLCSECIDGYGVAVNLFSYECVKCRGHEKYNWLLYLLAELGPITLVCFLVILLDVSVTLPALNAFVFFSQIVSVTYSNNFYIWFFGADQVVDNNNIQYLSYPLFTLYGVWNLEFLRNIVPGICLHEGLRTLHILVINYVKALYPMILVGVCYICIQLYDRNFRVLHFLWKPFRKCQKVIYKKYRPKTSIIDAFATLIILSYSKFLYVSFPLVNLISVYELGANETEFVPELLKYRYYFDPAEVLHHSMANIVYFMLGVIVLVVFVGCPPIFLILYPLRFVQACISRLNTRVQLRLRTFADIFLGAFRDGTEGGRDCRWFAGLYLILRIIFQALYVGISDPTTVYLIQQILCTLVLFLFALVRPYKVDFFNHLDTAFFTLLAILNSLSFYNSSLNKEIQLGVFCVNYILMYLPLVYLTIFIVYHILNWRGCFSREISKSDIDDTEALSDTSHVINSEDSDTYESDRLLPDRFVNPQNYRTLNRFSAHRSQSDQAKAAASGDEDVLKQDRQPSTDEAALLRNRPAEAEQVQKHGVTV